MVIVIDWLTVNFIEIFGVIAGILYVFLEIKQDVRLWPVGIVTSAIYIWVFFVNKLYADAGLQVYYLIISIFGWFWWIKSTPRLKRSDAGEVNSNHTPLKVSHIPGKRSVMLIIIFLTSYITVWQVLIRLTDSPVPAADAFITTLSGVATWMLAKKYIEHWYLWMVVNSVAAVLFFARGLYPTIILYFVYFAMSFVGLKEWKKTINNE